MELYLNESIIKRGALARFLKSCKAQKVDIHTLMIQKDGELICRLGVPPYTCSQKRQVFSMSKSFTSTAIGFACDEGLLRVEDKVLDYFPGVSCCGDRSLWEKLTIEDLLTMQTGHILDPTEPVTVMTDDWAAAFFRHPLVREPGTHYVYNTAATYMLSAILTKLTGETVLDYLWPRLFEPLGIVPEGWGICPKGISHGGWGIHISSEDALKFAAFYAADGIWNGQRLLSKEWIDRATRDHRMDYDNESPDWHAGYGYQFWRNARSGYRADGARGQFAIVYSKEGIVVSCFAMTDFIQNQLNCISTLIDEVAIDSDDDLELAVKAMSAEYFGGMSLTLPQGTWKAAPNHFNFTWMKFLPDDEGAALLISDGSSIQKLKFGKADWIKNRFRFHNFEPDIQLVRRPHDDPSHAACACKMESDGLHLILRFLDTPHLLEILVREDGDSLIFRLDWGTSGYDEAAREIRFTRL